MLILTFFLKRVNLKVIFLQFLNEILLILENYRLKNALKARMGGGNKEHTLLDSIRNGDSQTAIKILQNSMLNKNQSFKSRLNQKFMPNKQQHYKQVDLTSSSLSSINTSSIY